MSSSPFDLAKTILNTKETCYTVEELFNKEYAPFMINRILSNASNTVLFAEQMDKYSILDKKLQYDFYLYGIPKSRGYQKMWSKKESETTNEVLLDYISEKMKVNMRRASAILKQIGAEVVQMEMNSRGGKR